MSENKKPRLAEILNVEVGESLRLKDTLMAGFLLARLLYSNFLRTAHTRLLRQWQCAQVLRPLYFNQ